MPLDPSLWNVAVIGAWNVAILTPRGIASRLLGLPDGSAVEVQVPLDLRGPLRVIHGGIAVIPSNEQLSVEPILSTPESLKRSAEIADRAVRELPNTPMFAAGVNLRYHTSTNELTHIFRSPLEGLLAESRLGIEIATRTIMRQFLWNEGVINFEASEDEESGAVTLGLNFHLESTDFKSLSKWLQRVTEMTSYATSFFREVFKVEIRVGDV